jgi:hypothetical protein
VAEVEEEAAEVEEAGAAAEEEVATSGLRRRRRLAAQTPSAPVEEPAPHQRHPRTSSVALAAQDTLRSDSRAAHGDRVIWTSG